jgi:hypothetical protein
MPRRFTVVCDDDVASQVQSLALEYDITEAEVLRQLISLGLDERSGEVDA